MAEEKTTMEKSKELCRYFERCILACGGKIEQAQYGPDNKPVGHYATFKNVQLPTANKLSFAFINVLTSQRADTHGVFHVKTKDYDYEVGENRIIVDKNTKVAQIQVLLETEGYIYWDVIEQIDLADMAFQALVR